MQIFSSIVEFFMEVILNTLSHIANRAGRRLCAPLLEHCPRFSSDELGVGSERLSREHSLYRKAKARREASVANLCCL
jgi:hypothetical protein